jgi:hypothetical protein
MWGAHWTIELEKKGVPSAYIVDEPFIEDVQITCDKEGMPLLRRVIVPHPCGDISDKQLPKIMTQLVIALTAPLTEEEKKTRTIGSHEISRIAVTGTLESVQDYFDEQFWTDGLPIVPPTEAKVSEMLGGTSRSPDEIVTTTMWPEEGTATVEKIAINGIMAGCRPDYMPVLLAIAEAFGKGPFSSSVRSTNSFSFPILVNGPIAREIGMNSGVNALGSATGNKANATIGRFLRLAIINLGGSLSGVNDMSSQGNPSKYSFAFAENEQRSPWEPFHVSMGYKPDESVVSVFSGGWSHLGNFWGCDLDQIAKGIADFEWPNGVTILIDPMSARALKEKGYRKEDVEEYVWKNAAQTMGEFRAGHYYHIFIEKILKGKPMYGETYLWPEHYVDLPDSAVVQVYPRNHVKAVVVGGETNPFSQAWKFAYPSMVSVDKYR